MSAVLGQVPSPLSFREQSLRSFSSAYQKVYGEIIEGDELARKARSLLTLYRAVYGKPVEIIKN